MKRSGIREVACAIYPDSAAARLHPGYGCCEPDFSNDGIVNGQDAAYMRSVFGAADPNADLNGDGIVDSKDVVILGNFFGKPPGPSGRVATSSR